MREHSLILADRLRAEQFHALGRPGQALRKWTTWTDAQDILWAIPDSHCPPIAICGLGPGWIFDPYASQLWVSELAQRQQAWQQANAAKRQQLLLQAVSQVRTGRHAERLLWVVHRSPSASANRHGARCGPAIAAGERAGSPALWHGS